jgi:hypothetical protein
MPGAFLFTDLSADAAWSSAAATVATMPLSALADPQPRSRVRFATGSFSLVADLLSAVPVDVAALVSTTLSAQATVRVRLSTADATGAAGDAWDSGTAAADTSADANGNVVVLRSGGPATGRYLRWDVVDPLRQVVDVGLAPCGALLRLTYGEDFGAEEGRMINDARDTNAYTGAEFAVPAVFNPRMVQFTLPHLMAVEARGAFRGMVARLGAVGDALWVPDTALSRAELNLRSIWGGINRPGQGATVAQTDLLRFARAVSMRERG